MEDQIRGAHGELVGLYYQNMQLGYISVSEVSDIIDNHGWEGGWRIQDTSDSAIGWGCSIYDGELFDSLPTVFIVQTSSMKIVAAETTGAGEQLDVLAEVQDLDQ